MNTIKINTSQNIELEYDLGSLGDRILARIIDKIIVIAYVIIIIAVTVGFSGIGNLSSYGWLMVLFALPMVCYHLFFEILLNGQSPGKKVMKIKVISLSGEQPSFGQYLIRWLFRLIDFTITGGGLLALVMAAVSERKQRLGDYIAGTTVVKTTPRTQLSQTIYAPAPNPDYRVTYPEVVNLKDSDIELVKEVLRNFHRTGNTMVTIQAKQKIEQVLHIMSRQAESWDFLSVILRDYYHVTSQL